MSRHKGHRLWKWSRITTEAAAGKRCLWVAPRRDSWDELVHATELLGLGFTVESGGDVLRHESGGVIMLHIPGPDPMDPPKSGTVIIDDPEGP